MISDDRLAEIVAGNHLELTLSEFVEITRELLALRKATIPEEFLNATQNVSGMFELSEDCMCQLAYMLCSKPIDSTT